MRQDDPHPCQGSELGDVEAITYQGEKAYRLHIGRTHTAIYTVQEREKRVLIHELLDIDSAQRQHREETHVQAQYVLEHSSDDPTGWTLTGDGVACESLA